MKKIATLLILLLVTGGCKKDPPVTSPTDCSDFSSEGCNGFGFSVFYYDSTQFISPCINPNNANEFVYLYRNSNNSTLNGIYKYNISTKVKVKLTSISALSQPKWGKNNWILFSKANVDYREIYKIKSDGDSLTQITANQYDLFPEWDNANNRIIFNRQIYLGSPSSKILICKFDGTILDSINNQYFKFGACNQSSELALPPFSKRECGITTINSLTKSEVVLNDPAGSSCAAMNQGIAWHPNNNDIFYTSYYGSLYKINKTSKQQTVLKSFCDTKTFSSVSVSPDGSFLLVERIDGRLENCKQYYKSTIYKVSIDGKTESKIEME